MTGGRASREKGNRTERAILQQRGFAAELRDIIEGLDEVHSSLMGEALTGEYGAFVRSPTPFGWPSTIWLTSARQRNGGRGA